MASLLPDSHQQESLHSCNVTLHRCFIGLLSVRFHRDANINLYSVVRNLMVSSLPGYRLGSSTSCKQGSTSRSLGNGVALAFILFYQNSGQLKGPCVDESNDTFMN